MRFQSTLTISSPRIGANLTAILKGTTTSLFEADKVDMSLEYQTHAVGLEKANTAARSWLDLQAHKRPDFDYLEIATGPSALTRPALEILGGKTGNFTPRFSKYTFTNSNEHAFNAVRTNLRPWQDKVQLKTLDIEQDPTTQGLKKESFDVIIASNVCAPSFFIDFLELISASETAHMQKR